jgi:hypothetical protein
MHHMKLEKCMLRTPPGIYCKLLDYRTNYWCKVSRSTLCRLHNCLIELKNTDEIYRSSALWILMCSICIELILNWGNNSRTLLDNLYIDQFFQYITIQNNLSQCKFLFRAPKQICLKCHTRCRKFTLRQANTLSTLLDMVSTLHYSSKHFQDM